jgi:hypothetical protein
VKDVFTVHVDFDKCFGHIDLKKGTADERFTIALHGLDCIERVSIVEGRDVYVLLVRGTTEEELAKAVQPLVASLRLRQQ